MRLYFDTNVYHFICQVGERDEVRDFLREAGHAVGASDTILHEMYANPDGHQRRAEIKTLTAVASTYCKKPQSWHHAREVRLEIARLRPHWLRSVPLGSREKRFLRGHAELWQAARDGGKRPADIDYGTFRPVFESGRDKSRRYQKAMRSDRLDGQGKHVVAKGNRERKQATTEADLSDPHVFWRQECLAVWYNAVAYGEPATRDYADWLKPHLRDGAFDDESYQDFWIGEVEAERVPKNRLTSLVSFYQMAHKITSGNSQDQNHASYVLDVDAFLTADRAFHAVLVDVVAKHFPHVRVPVLLDRNAGSVVQQLRASLEAVP